MRGQFAFAQGTVTRMGADSLDEPAEEAAFHERACLPWNSARSVEANRFTHDFTSTDAPNMFHGKKKQPPAGGIFGMNNACVRKISRLPAAHENFQVRCCFRPGGLPNRSHCAGPRRRAMYKMVGNTSVSARFNFERSS